MEGREVLEYLTASGISPFAEWRRTLDVRVRERIDRVIERFYDGNLGDHKGVGEGLVETRINAGPGYRVYYGCDRQRIIILLAGGIKRSQPRDIYRAKKRWSDYKDRKRKGD